MAALCDVAAVLAAVVRKSAPEMGHLLLLAGVAVGVAVFAPPFVQLWESATALLGKTGLAPEIFAPLLKTMGIAIVVRLAGAWCTDAGAQSLAAALEVVGTVLAVTVSLPLLQTVLSMLEEWI